MKILIVNRFFGGAQIPTGRMAEDVGRVLVAEGHEVTALASSGAYEGAAQAGDQEPKRPKDQKTGDRGSYNGVQMREVGSQQSGELRVETVPVPRWMPRALAWLWFTWQARKRIPRMEWDVCVLMTDPPLLPLLVPRAKVAGIRHEAYGRREEEELKHRTTALPPHRATRRVAVWLMDLYPEALAASGRLSARNPLYRWYFEKRQKALEACELLLFLGETQRALVGRWESGKVGKWEGGEWQTKTVVVPPWDDRGNIALATEESLQNLALYAGNLGEAHCFEEILAAAPFLPGDWKVRFAVRGKKLAALKAAASGTTGPRDYRTTGDRRQGTADRGRQADDLRLTDLKLKTAGAGVEITGYASEEETPQLLASARVHLITMSPGWEGIVVPSKLYGCIRTGRPVLFIGPENADTARAILRNDWGAVLPPGVSGETVAAAIMELAARPTLECQLQKGAADAAKSIQTLGEE